MSYGVNTLAPECPMDAQMPSVTTRLLDERSRLKARLEAVEAAIDALEDNPNLQIAMDAISKLGHF